jgi:hypothetical protein
MEEIIPSFVNEGTFAYEANHISQWPKKYNEIINLNRIYLLSLTPEKYWINVRKSHSACNHNFNLDIKRD